MPECRILRILDAHRSICILEGQTMKLAIFRDIVEVSTVEELRDRLRFRDESSRVSFWLWHDSGTELSVVVCAEDAYALFVDADGFSNHSTLDVMTHSNEPRTYVGGVGPSLYVSYSGQTETCDEVVEFLADNGEELSATREYVVPLSRAIEAMEDFFCSGQRSARIEWHKLCSPKVEPPRKFWWQFWK